MTFNRLYPALTACKKSGTVLSGWLLACLVTTLALFFAGAAQAQLRVDISGTGAQQYPVAIADFSGDAAGSQIAEIIRADLTRSGQFRLIATKGSTLNVDSAIAFDEWRTRGADFIAYGSVIRLPDGRFEVKYRLGDTVKRGPLDGFTVSGTEKELRRMSHQIADRIYEKITGIKGVFATRIAYVLKQGKTYELQIADADGQNPQVALARTDYFASLVTRWRPAGLREF